MAHDRLLNAALRVLGTRLDASDERMAAFARAGGADVDASAMGAYRRESDDAGFLPCPSDVIAHFLHGLIVQLRGPREGQGDGAAPIDTVVTNNVIMKKVRIAFSLKDADVAAIFAAAGVTVTKSERASYFRHPDDEKYRECSDPVLLTFLNGLPPVGTSS